MATKPKPTTSGRKGTVSPGEKLKVWVRAGGRCVFCGQYLLQSNLTLRPVFLGEVAHNVAASDEGPRGDSSFTQKQRNSAENLLLLCGAHHPDTDKLSQLDLLTVEQVQALKDNHERRVLEATSTVTRSNTAILRMQGYVRDAMVDLNVEAATEAVLRSSNRFPELALSFDRRSIEIDLRNTAGENEATAQYYGSATQIIDQIITSVVRPAVNAGAVRHLSVFAFARLPLLVYLGSRIDDALEVDVFQYHRSTQSWVWPASTEANAKFVVLRAPSPTGDDPAASEAALIINASGTIHRAELPADTEAMPTYFIELDEGIPSHDTVQSCRVRDSFRAAIETLLAQIEVTNKSVRRIHVFAAMPVSLAVILGRSIGWGIQSSLVVYDRVDNSYHPALEITAP